MTTKKYKTSANVITMRSVHNRDQSGFNHLETVQLDLLNDKVEKEWSSLGGTLCRKGLDVGSYGEAVLIWPGWYDASPKSNTDRKTQGERVLLTQK